MVIVAEPLAARVGAEIGRSFDRKLAVANGKVLEGLKFRHPLYDRESVGVLADYVTLEQGTGAVHTAPGHGADDFLTGAKYGLDIYAPVDASGHFFESVELFGGKRVFDANPSSRRTRDARTALASDAVAHQYPHCWRCHIRSFFLRRPSGSSAGRRACDYRSGWRRGPARGGPVCDRP